MQLSPRRYFNSFNETILKEDFIMFLFGMFVGVISGVAIIKLHNLMNDMDSQAKQFASDAKETYAFWKEKRKKTE